MEDKYPIEFISYLTGYDSDSIKELYETYKSLCIYYSCNEDEEKPKWVQSALNF